jgi:hypothetical protein
MPRRLTKLRIDEVSAVDRSANQHAQVVLRKRDPAADFRRIFGVPTLRDELAKAAAKSPPKLQDEEAVDEADDVHEGDGDGELEDDEVAASKQHIVSTLANLAVEAGAAADRPSALHYLMHTARGAELVRRLKRQKEQTTMTSPIEEMTSIAKAGGIDVICEHIVAKGSSLLDEHSLVKLFTDTVPRRSGESAAQAFSRAYTASEQMRRAVQVAKSTPFPTAAPMVTAKPSVVGGAAAQDVDDATDALAQLEALAAKLRAQFPELSKAQAFAKVFSDPANRQLAAAERRQNRPTA